MDAAGQGFFAQAFSAIQNSTGPPSARAENASAQPAAKNVSREYLLIHGYGSDGASADWS
jgi:hypothetical protein